MTPRYTMYDRLQPMWWAFLDACGVLLFAVEIRAYAACGAPPNWWTERLLRKSARLSAWFRLRANVARLAEIESRLAELRSQSEEG